MGIELEKECVEALKAHQTEYLNTVWKTFAALMVAIGWVISSDKTREFISTIPEIKFVFIGVVVSMAVMHWLTLNDLYQKSKKVKELLRSESHVLNAISESYEIKRIYTFASFTINGLMHVVLLVAIWYAK